MRTYNYSLVGSFELIIKPNKITSAKGTAVQEDSLSDGPIKKSIISIADVATVFTVAMLPAGHPSVEALAILLLATRLLTVTALRPLLCGPHCLTSSPLQNCSFLI